MPAEFVNPSHRTFLETSPTLFFQGTSGHIYHINVMIVPVSPEEELGFDISLWVATSGWTSGVPSGGTLVYTVCLDSRIMPSMGPVAIPVVISGTQKLVHRLQGGTGGADAYLEGLDWS